jgi:single-stranded-DNA-specific exonuclease
MIPVTAITASISGLAWRWRGGNMELPGEPGLDSLVDQLLLARGVARDDLERQRRPTLRAFLPNPSIFRDMDTAAARLAQAVEAGQAIAVYGDYDVDGATSAALLIRMLRDLGIAARAYIPDRLLEGYGPSGEALVRLKNEGAQLIARPRWLIPTDWTRTTKLPPLATSRPWG